MTNSPLSASPNIPDDPAAADAWRRWGRGAGYVAGPLFLLQTYLFLLDVTGALAPPVRFVDTPAGVMEDRAAYYFAVNERMHTIWWDVALRDIAGPIGYLALILLVIAVVRVAGTRQPRQEIAALVVVLGASLGTLNDLMYLSYTRWWRHGGFSPTPDIVAFGISQDVVDNIGNYFLRSGYILIAIGFTLLAPTLGRVRPGWRWISLLARMESLAMLTWVVADIAEMGTTRYIAAVTAGLVLGPALIILTGHALAIRRPNHYRKRDKAAHS